MVPERPRQRELPWERDCWAMFDEGEWKDTDGGALLPPQQHLWAPAGSLPKQHRQILGSSSCTESPQRPRPLPGASESESGLAGRPGRNRRQGLKRRAASSSPVIAPGPGPEPEGRSRGKGSSATAPGVSKEQPSQELGAAVAPSLSRKQWRNKQKNKRRQKNKFKVGAGQGPNAGPEQVTPVQPQSELSGALRARMEERLQSARFRYINQQLYTSSSQEAAQFFQQDPEAFAIYHRGFSQQVGRWPENPVHRIIQYLRARPASLVVADFGCGDCKIATSVRNKVHSFDLVALNPCVTVCDMAKVPLADESVDVAVFCLALMGTNLREILEEANRVLKPGGVLKLAEVASRFVDIQAFINAMAQLGFQIASKALGNRYFAALDFRKRGPPRAGGAAPGLRLRPCRYKPR